MWTVNPNYFSFLVLDLPSMHEGLIQSIISFDTHTSPIILIIVEIRLSELACSYDNPNSWCDSISVIRLPSNVAMAT